VPLANPMLSGMQDVFFEAPSFLPGPGHFLLLTKSLRGSAARELALADLDGSSLVTFGQGSWGVYSPTGHVLFALDGALWARGIQRSPWKGQGDPFLVAQQGSLAQLDGESASISADNTLVYVRRMGGGLERLIFKNRQGQTVGELGQPQTDIFMPRLSPDQKSAVVRSAESGASNIWIHTAGKKSRLTFEESAD